MSVCVDNITGTFRKFFDVHYKLLQRILQNFNAGGLMSGWSFFRVVFCPVVFCPYTRQNTAKRYAVPDYIRFCPKRWFLNFSLNEFSDIIFVPTKSETSLCGWSCLHSWQLDTILGLFDADRNCGWPDISPRGRRALVDMHEQRHAYISTHRPPS